MLRITTHNDVEIVQAQQGGAFSVFWSGVEVLRISPFTAGASPKTETVIVELRSGERIIHSLIAGTFSCPPCTPHEVAFSFDTYVGRRKVQFVFHSWGGYEVYLSDYPQAVAYIPPVSEAKEVYLFGPEGEGHIAKVALP